MFTSPDKSEPLKVEFKKYGDIMDDGIHYIHSRALGKIKSLRTQWKQFNKIGLNGIEWHSLYVIAARPGVGKTLIAASLTRELQRLNTDQDFSVLHFQFEMLGRNMALRELSAGSGLDIRYLQSAQDDGMPPLTRGDFEKLKKYAADQHSRNEFVVDRALTVNEMRYAILNFYKIQGKPFVVTLDHTLLVKQGGSESNKQITLQNLAIMLTEMKNSIPVIFLILTQLNREIDDPERQKPTGNGSGHYPTESDVYGSDFLNQCADVMIAFNRPAKYNLSLYGPHKYLITDKYLLAMHILKNRFGEVGLQWYKAEYSKMTIVEVPAPATKMVRIGS